MGRHGRWRTSISGKRDKPMEVSRGVDSLVVIDGTWNAGSMVPVTSGFERRQEGCKLVEVRQGSGQMIMERFL